MNDYEFSSDDTFYIAFDPNTDNEARIEKELAEAENLTENQAHLMLSVELSKLYELGREGYYLEFYGADS